jgi:hypothetical protein
VTPKPYPNVPVVLSRKTRVLDLSHERLDTVNFYSGDGRHGLHLAAGTSEAATMPLYSVA